MSSSTPQPLPNSQFRELDDEYLQNRSKEWLEAVLRESLDGSQGLAELIADGSILYRVSKVVKDLIRDSGGEAIFPKLSSWVAAIEEKQTSKYVPYSNVDSFLKICKRVGLPDVDLFIPSDVVEKKDIRRVCLCIRALSKRGRANGLELPDFDEMVYTFQMPSEKVGGIREHLEHSGGKPTNQPNRINLDDTSIQQSSKALSFENVNEASDSPDSHSKTGNELQSALEDEVNSQRHLNHLESKGELSDQVRLKEEVVEVNEEISSKGNGAFRHCSVDDETSISGGTGLPLDSSSRGVHALANPSGSVDEEDIVSEGSTVVLDSISDAPHPSTNASDCDGQSLRDSDEEEQSPSCFTSADSEPLAIEVLPSIHNGASLNNQKECGYTYRSRDEAPDLQNEVTELLSPLSYSNKYDEPSNTTCILDETHVRKLL